MCVFLMFLPHSRNPHLPEFRGIVPLWRAAAVLPLAKAMGVCTLRVNISCLCFDMPTPAYLASNSGTRAVGLIGLTAMDIVQFITIV